MNQTSNLILARTAGPFHPRHGIGHASRRTAVRTMLVVAFALGGTAFAQTETDCDGFQEHSIMAGGTNGAASVHAADLNDDTYVDLISASSNDDTIAWYRNLLGDPGGTPTAKGDPGFPGFERLVIATDADGVTSVHAVDVDGDGDVDVLAASANDNTIAIYENVGVDQSVTFVRKVVTASARRALSVFAADIDGDGDVDVLSASYTDNTIAWYENPEVNNEDLNPDGASIGFTRRIVSDNAANASAVYAADVDGDGRIDVLSASIADDKIAWHKNIRLNDDDPNAPFIEFAEHVVTTEADGARSVFAVDIDDDSDIDILSASISDDTVALYENVGVVMENGAEVLKFDEHLISTTADGAKSVFAAHIDGDDDLDIVVAAEQAGTVYWFENLGDAASFAPHMVSTDVTSADAVYAIDVDGDGPVDVLSASSALGSVSDEDKVAWFRNSGATTPAWEENVVASTAEGLNALFLADIDGDLEEDLVGATTTDQIVWYKIDRDSGVVFNRNPVADGVLDARSVFAYDMDGDGDEDILSASAAADRILLHENPRLPASRKRGAGTSPLDFGDPQVIATTVDSVESIFVIDLDGDSDGDVLSASSGDDTVRWFENLCGESCDTPAFIEHFIAAPDELDSRFRTLAPRAVFAIDVDGDTDIDVVTASSGDDKVSIFESDFFQRGETGRPEFEERIIASASPSESVFREEGASAVSATDVDEDGDVDLLVAASGAGSISWYEREVDPENAALVSYTRHAINENAPQAAFVGFADVDGDGDDDVLATSLGNDRVLWHENLLVTDSEDLPLFRRHVVNFDGANPRSIVTLDVDQDGVDGEEGDLDMLVGFRFRSSWFEHIGELCVSFDVNGDDGDEVINGLELAWVGRAFGLSSDTPEDQWWFEADFNRDGVVDGLDLAILSSPGVWGESTAVVDGATECSYTCQ